MKTSFIHKLSYSCIITLLLCIVHPISANNNFEITTVALDGDYAPGANDGSTFFAFNDVAVNEAGQVFFRAFLVTQGFDDCDEGLWIGGPNELSLIACEGFPAPDTEEGTTFLAPGGGFPGSGIPDDIGQVGFNSRLRGADIPFNDGGIWLGSPSNVSLLVREGDQAPGTPDGVEFEGISTATMLLSNTGIVAFPSILTGLGVDASNNFGIWLGSLSDNLSLVARKGDPAPDTNDGVVFSDIDTIDYSVNDNGEVAFRGYITGPGVTFENNRGIWVGGPHNLGLAIREGDSIPSLPAGSNYERISSASLNNNGEIAFTSWVTGIPNTWWLWAGSPDSPSLVARAGDPAPGTDTDVVFGNILYPILINGAGEVAFKSFLFGPDVTSSNNVGIWSGRPGALKLVARAGDQAPGALPDQNFSNLGSISINGSGSLVVDSSLTGFEPTSGVWHHSKSDGLKEVAVPGQTIEVRTGDVRTIQAADAVPTISPLTGNQDGRRSNLTDTEMLAFRLSFDDGSRGVFLAMQSLVEEISIDIKPRRDSNKINLVSNSVIPVAILSTDVFNALDVDPDTVLFGPAGAVDVHNRAHEKDVDKDGDIDLLFHFRTQDAGIQCGDIEATIIGKTWDGSTISGTDSINTVGCQ